MVTLTGCTSYGYVIWLHKLWSHLTAQLVVTLCGCRTYGYVMWLQNLRLRYVAAELLAMLCDFRTYGYVMWLQNFWSSYLTAHLPHISSKKCPSYFRLQSLIWTDKKHEIKVPLQKLTVPQLLKIFPEFYRIRSFNSKFVTVCHWSLSWSRLVRSTTSHIVSLRPNLTLRTGKSVGHL
jgi:FtsH-binding integral membrane protein